MRSIAALLLATLVSASAFAQSSSPVTGINNFIHSTTTLADSVAFYREVFGFAQPPPPRPPNPGVPPLINVPGALLQVSVFRLPAAGFGWELTEFGGIERVTLTPPQPTDPGSARLIMRVRDLAPVVAALKKTGAPVISRGGGPVEVDTPVGKLPAILFRDPDGYPVEVIQVPPTVDAPEGNLIGAAMAIVVEDMDKALGFYRDLLGFNLTGDGKFIGQHGVLDLVAAPQGSEFRRMLGTVPGTPARIELYEFRGMPRTRFHGRVPDPGVPAIALQVTDLDGLVAKVKAAGITIVSVGGVPAQFSPTIRNIFVEDPSGFKVELYEVSQ